MSYGTTPPPPPPGYDPSMPAYGGQPATNSGKAVASLVLGIVGICCSGVLVVSALAIVFSFLAKKEIATSGGMKKGTGLATAGLVLGIIGVLLGILNWILVATGAVDLNFDTTTT